MKYKITYERKREIEQEWEELTDVLQLNELCAALKWIEENGEDHTDCDGVGDIGHEEDGLEDFFKEFD